MPKLTRQASHHRYSNPMPVSVPVTLPPVGNTMAYFNPRPTLPTYYDVSAAGQPQGMTVSSYEPYAVTPLSIPTTTTANIGGPVGGGGSSSSLPPQHRASSGAWNAQDDQTLLAARSAGQNWSQIQASYFPSKTGNACRKRHERLMERKGADDWDTRRLEQMSKEYMSMRKEIWQPLADRCNVKWNVVEQKCMSNGLKNIQSHARAYARRERLESGHPGGMTGYDDDSGISGIGLTPVDDMEHAYDSPGCEEASSSTGGNHSSSAGSGSSTASQNAYSTSLQSQGSYHHHQGYGGYGGGGGHQQGAHHGYNSSVSSSGTAGYGQGQQGGHPSPYMGHGGNRMPSVDMGIDAIINRGKPGGQHGV